MILGSAFAPPFRNSLPKGSSGHASDRRSARAERFEYYLALLSEELDHADRVKPLRDYVTGLLLAGKRKSIEPIAGRIDPGHFCARHQSLHHFIAIATSKDRALLRVICQQALPALLHLGEIENWVVDDTGFPKCGKHSVGVERQSCGRLGKTDNCQVAVSLMISHRLASLPIAFDLYLTKRWAYDWVRRKKAGMLREIKFRTKHEIALAQIDAALLAGLSRGIINADVGFGNYTDFRDALTTRRLHDAVGIQATTTVWPRRGKDRLCRVVHCGKRVSDCRTRAFFPRGKSWPIERHALSNIQR